VSIDEGDPRAALDKGDGRDESGDAGADDCNVVDVGVE
jgi:hypothetical protein